MPSEFPVLKHQDPYRTQKQELPNAGITKSRNEPEMPGILALRDSCQLSWGISLRVTHSLLISAVKEMLFGENSLSLI